MSKILKITFLLIFVLAGYGSCSAQESYQEGELITLYVGEIKVVSVANPTRIAVSHPDDCLDLPSAGRFDTASRPTFFIGGIGQAAITVGFTDSRIIAHPFWSNNGLQSLISFFRYTQCYLLYLILFCRPKHNFGDVIDLHPGVLSFSGAAEDIFTVGTAAYDCFGAGYPGFLRPFAGRP